MLKAYKIITKIHNLGDFGIYVAENAGRAKTKVVYDMSDAGYRTSDYSWIISCRRSPEFDYLSKYAHNNQRDCVAYKDGRYGWQADKGRDEGFPIADEKGEPVDEIK